MTPKQNDHSKNPARCGYHGYRNNQGNPCGGWLIPGTKTCKRHAGKPITQARAEGRVRLEVLKWGLGDTTVDPGEVLLRLVSQSAARVDLYSRLLADAYHAAERLRQAEQAPDTDLVAAHTARMDLERVFNTGGVSALIGHTYAGTQTSGVIATGEAIRGLAQLEAAERDRCANFATKAIAAGLAERQVRLAERQGALIATVMRQVMERVGATAQQLEALPAVTATVLAEVAGVDTRADR